MAMGKLFKCLWVAALLAWSTSDSWSGSPAQTVIAVIAAKKGVEQSLDKESLARIFMRKTTIWSNGDLIQPVNLIASHALRRLFIERITGLEPEELESYWNDQYYHGIFPPFAVESEEAVIRFVSVSNSAIGYVSACATDERVRVLLYLTSSGIVHGGGGVRYCQQH